METPRLLGKLFLLLGIIFFLNACYNSGDANGGDGNDETVVFTISTAVDANGSISPISVDVNENSTVDLTITPDPGYEIDTVSGCGGSLAGNTYTTGAITTDCTVAVTFVARLTMAITDIFVHDTQFALPSPDEGYEPIVRCTTGGADCGYRAGGFDVNEGIGGDTVVILMKQEEVFEDSDTIVITDVVVAHWSRDDAWFPSCPEGYEFASGNNNPDGSALTTGTDSSCKRMGLCVRKAMMKDAMINRPLATINLNKTTGGVASPAIATVDGHLAFDGEGYRQTSVSRDIHEGCGDDYFFNIVGYKTEPDSRLLPKPEMDVVDRPDVELDHTQRRNISLAETLPGLDYHSIFGIRTEHLQAMIRLPDRNGNEYYMGTFSQDCEDNDCGMVFVGEVPSGESNGDVIWIDYLRSSHPAQGFNHPGDLHRIGDYVIIAGQNWYQCWGVNCLDTGGGGEAVLFYEVTNPAEPVYVGKMNACWQGDSIERHNGDIDTIGAAKIDDTYYISFNDLRCKSDSFHPYAHWEVIAQEGSSAHSPVKFEYEGITYVGKAAVGDLQIVWKAYTDNFHSLVDVLTTPKPYFDYIVDHRSLSTMPDGTYCAISTDVESDTSMNLRMICN